MVNKTLTTLENFRSEVMARNLARPNRFEVLIQLPKALSSERGVENGRLVSIFCESTTLPTKTIGVRQQKIQGPAYQRPVSIDYGGEGITMTFLVDQQMIVKEFFDHWMEKVISNYSFNVNYQDEYTSLIRIYQLNQQDERVYGVMLTDAFPRAIAQMDLNHSTQNQVHKLNVTFAYRKWEATTLRNSFLPKISNVVDTAKQSGSIFDIFKKSSVTDSQLKDRNYTGDIKTPVK